MTKNARGIHEEVIRWDRLADDFHDYADVPDLIEAGNAAVSALEDEVKELREKLRAAETALVRYMEADRERMFR